MTTKRPFAELLAGISQNKISLGDALHELNQRGPVQSPLHRAELAMVDEALAKNRIDDRLHRLLTSKLKDLQNPKAATVGGDATVVGGAGGDRTRINPGPGTERTTLNPGPGAGGRKPDGDATVVNTGGGNGNGGFDLLMGAEDEKTEMAGGGGAETTGFKPSDPATGSRTGGTTGGTGTGGPSTSSWNRVAATGAPEREVHAGDVLKDRFYLDKEVGRGGMGIVFKARDERKVEAQDKNPWVAVKVLNPEFRKHPQALVALQRESRKAQQLTHDNILRVYDFDKDGTVIYMTMEYVDGGSLKDVIKKHPAGMPFDKGWPIIAGLARGLGRAHRDNIVHSDFKPGNVMMTSDMIPKLFDMGIARAAKSGAEAKGETTVFDAGELGALTPAYASLEMIQGQPPELIDDIYALGITAYEILTGKHPFGKKNAEQVMKEGLKPPAVPGLSRRQRKTLEGSVAFKRADRVKTCDDFLEGMRQLAFKDYALPMAIGSVAFILLLVGIFGGLLPFLKNKRIDAVGEQFTQGVFAQDTGAAIAALDAMKADEKESAKQKYSQQIQDYFFKVSNDKWDIAAKPPHYDFRGASTVLESVKQIFPDSARVAQNIDKLTGEKDKKLGELRDEFKARLDAGLIYEDKPGNVVETLTTVALIDPTSELLANKSLPLRYADDVQRSLDSRNFERAASQVATAVKAFPKNEALASLSTQVKTFRDTEVASAKERELREKMTAAQAKDELTKLAGNPLFTPDWQVNVNVAMSKLTGDTTPETAQMKEKLVVAYAGYVGKMTGDKQLGSAQLVADAAMKLFPGAPALMKEVGKLTEARKAFEGEKAKQAALARVDDLKSTLLAQAKGGEVQKAVKSLAELKLALAPTDPFLVTEAPAAIGDAYLKMADKQAAQNRFSEAGRLAKEGLKLAPNSDALKAADKKYYVEGGVQTLQAGASSPATAKAEEMKQALEAVRTGDATRADKVVADTQSGVLARLQALTQSDPAAAGKGKAEWLKVFPQYQQLASLVIPEATTPAPATTVPLPQEAKKAISHPRGQETCLTSYSTFGKNSKATCADDVAGVPGPKLVVIPNPAGGFMAITKYEVTVGQFDAFCAATKKCKAAGGNDTLPRTNISLSLAKAYAAWLTETTGFTYRLPSEAEWTHAANAAGAGPGEDFNCVLMQGSNQIKGGLPVPANTGRPNPWGLVNVVGNAAEWVEDGSARGGSFNVPMSQCTVDWRQSGSESDSIGLRLVREMG